MYLNDRNHRVSLARRNAHLRPKGAARTVRNCRTNRRRSDPRPARTSLAAHGLPLRDGIRTKRDSLWDLLRRPPGTANLVGRRPILPPNPSEGTLLVPSDTRPSRLLPPRQRMSPGPLFHPRSRHGSTDARPVQPKRRRRRGTPRPFFGGVRLGPSTYESSPRALTV